MEYMENENIYTLHIADFRKYNKTSSARNLLIKFLLSSRKECFFMLLLTISMAVYFFSKNSILFDSYAAYLSIVFVILFLLFRRITFMKFINKFGQKDFQVFHDINFFFYHYHFLIFYRKKNYRNMFLLNMAYANIELGDFLRFEQCMALIYKRNAGRFKKMYGFSNSKEKLRLSLQEISPRSEEINRAFLYLLQT